MAWTGPNWKPAKGSRLIERKERKLANAEKLAHAYAEVDKRDQSICWVTGKFLTPGAVSPEERREHHHLKGRRVRPDWVYKPERIITVSKAAHDLITGKFIDVEGEDARKPIFFHWNAAAMRGQVKPIVIVGKRWRAA